MMIRYALVGALGVALLGCDSNVGGGETVDLGDADTTQEPIIVKRERRRMDIDQLDAALQSVSGGIYWVKPGDTTKTNQLTALSTTLGKPDYIEITLEDTAATSIFLKFLDDAARAVCTDLVAADAERDERVFVNPASFSDDPAASSIDATLTRALLRFHGRKVVDASELSSWRTLFTDVVTLDATANPDGNTESHAKAAWTTVCVGLVSSPDFYTY